MENVIFVSDSSIIDVPTFYFINESTTRLICNVIDILDVINEDFFAGVCTQDNLIVTVAKINGQ
jgi:hypothetical protein